MPTHVETLSAIHDFAVVGAIDPTKALMGISATAGLIGSLGAISVVKQGEMGIRTFGDHPVLQSDIAAQVNLDIQAREKANKRLSARDRFEIRNTIIDELPEERLAEGIYKIVGPGPHLVPPLFGGIAKIPVNIRTSPVEDDFAVESNDGQQHLVKPSFMWRVRRDGDNPHHARFKINNDRRMSDRERDRELEQTIVWICLDGMAVALRNRSAENLQNLDSIELTNATREARAGKLLEFGVELVDILLRPVARTPEERLAQALESMSSDATRSGAAAVAIHDLTKADIVSMPPRNPTDAA